MEELAILLNNIEDSYYDFVTAMLHYAEKTPARQELMLNHLKNNPFLKSSDLIKFISNQADFMEDASNIKVG